VGKDHPRRWHQSRMNYLPAGVSHRRRKGPLRVILGPPPWTFACRLPRCADMVREYNPCQSAPAGSRTVKTEPLPGSLVTVTSPPIMRASLRVMARPRPVPQPDLDVAANISRSFEQCVGTEQECFWNHEAHGLRGPQVNGQLELRRLLYR
jgi:hypothetical protein